MDRLPFDPVGDWITANIHRTFDEYPVTHSKAIRMCFMHGQQNLKLEYRISGSYYHRDREYINYSLRFNPWTWAQSQTNIDSEGHRRKTINVPALTHDGWFEPGQIVTKSIVWGTPKLLITWKQFVSTKLFSPSADASIRITIQDSRYLKIMQLPTEEDAGWGLYVDLEVDCGLYFCQYTLDRVIQQEVEASSVHVLLSGESSFNEYERDSAGELTLVGALE